MSSIALINCIAPDCSGVDANRGYCDISTFNNITISRQRSFDISLTTTDSDRVTIHSSSQFEARFSAYNRQGMIDEEVVDVSARSYACGTAKNISLAVEGALDKEEAGDIRKAVRQVDKFFRRLQAGDLKHAMKRISKLDKLDSIAGMQAALQSSQRVSVTQQAEISAGTSSTIQDRATAPDADA